MRMTVNIVTLLVLAGGLSSHLTAAPVKTSKFRSGIGESTQKGPAVLWREPNDIASRNLFYGPGGKKHQPAGGFTFEKEDLKGTNPKYVVRDRDGVKWKIKLGEEARPETVATRLVWAVGYSADEVYFLPHLRVDNVPAKLHRGRKLVGPDGSMQNARLERKGKGEEKAGIWKWSSNPFTGQRELNGLRVMMALINNWDLKDINNNVMEKDNERIYKVGDLGASFGTNGRAHSLSVAKGNLDSYRRSKFIIKETPNTVSFATPSAPSLAFLFTNPPQYLWRLPYRWIGRDIPRADASWMGHLLARLSPDQIRDAFRAAAYTPEQVEQFSGIVRQRIADLNKL